MSLDHFEDPWAAFEREERQSLVGRLLSGRRAWWAVAAAGFVLFEITADAALALVLACLKFGWDETRIARRLKREDPDRVRGRVCARFYQAYALWKVSGMAFVAMVLVVIVQVAVIERLAPGGWKAKAGPPAAFTSLFLLLMVCFTLSAAWSLRSTIGAIRKGVRVWVGYRRNRLKPILLSVVVVWGTIFLVLGTGLAAAAIFGARPAGQQGWPGAGFIALASFVIPIGFPVGVLVSLDWLERRIAARYPEDCWPELLTVDDVNRPAFLDLLRV